MKVRPSSHNMAVSTTIGVHEAEIDLIREANEQLYDGQAPAWIVVRDCVESRLDDE